MKHKYVHFWAVPLLVITTAAITGAGTSFLLQDSDKKVDTEAPKWQTYTSENGFSFNYPSGHDVNENADPENSDVTNVFIVKVDEDGETFGSPVMQINVSDYSVSFSLWEGIPWYGYPDIIKTFKQFKI
ncbi:hypothetical protein ACFL3C_01330 [Patescibacteria group bacterium]